MSEETEAGPGGVTPQARLTPYELVFTDRFETVVFPTVVREGQQHAIDPLELDRFHLLAAVGDAVRDVVPPEAPPEALEQYRALLYHAFNFWRFEKSAYLLDPAVARYLVEAAPQPHDWELALPRPSVYIQLPTNLFWGSISADATPEPVDGFFVASSAGLDGLGKPFQRVAILVVLGIRRHRAGFSVIPIETETGPGIAADWAAAEGRETGGEFQSTLPGGELSGLYSIVTTHEVLKLVGRALWYIDSFPQEIVLESPGEAALEAAGSLPLPGLPYHRVRLGQSPPQGA